MATFNNNNTTVQQQAQESLLLKELVAEVEEPQMEKKEKKKHRPLFGYFFMLVGSLLICINFTLNKLAIQLTAIEHMVLRYSIQLVIAFCICKYKGLFFLGKKGERKLLSIRGTLGVSVVFSTFVAIKLVPPSDCITILNTTAIITAIVCRIFIKEKLTIVHVFAALLGVVGVVCIFRPTFLFKSQVSLNSTRFEANLNSTEQQQQELEASLKKQELYTIIGSSLALFTAFTYAVSTLLMKKLSTAKVHFALVTIYPAVLSLPFLLIIATTMYFIGYSHRDFNADVFLLHLLYSSVGGTCGALGVLCITLSFKYEDASKLTIVKTTDVFFSFILQFFIAKIQADFFGILGAVFILSGTLTIILVKLMENKIEKSNKCLKLLIYKF